MKNEGRILRILTSKDLDAENFLKFLKLQRMYLSSFKTSMREVKNCCPNVLSNVKKKNFKSFSLLLFTFMACECKHKHNNTELASQV